METFIYTKQITVSTENLNQLIHVTMNQYNILLGINIHKMKTIRVHPFRNATPQ